MVLFYLADRHNPDYGCFPMQATLANDAEMSVASVNNHLNTLEDAGLIRRVKRVDRKTGKQQSTRYILGFEDGFEAKPCPDIGDGPDRTTREQLDAVLPDEATDLDDALPVGKPVDNLVGNEKSDSKKAPIPTPKNGDTRLQSLETNPVREPLREPVKEEEARERDEFELFFRGLLDAVGFKHGQSLPGWWQGETPRRHVRSWTDNLGLSRGRILEVAESTRHDHETPPDGPKGLDRAMERDAKKRPAAKGASARMSDDEIAKFYGDWVNSEKFLVPKSLGPVVRQLLLQRGIVTEARLRERSQ